MWCMVACVVGASAHDRALPLRYATIASSVHASSRYYRLNVCALLLSAALLLYRYNQPRVTAHADAACCVTLGGCVSFLAARP